MDNRLMKKARYWMFSFSTVSIQEWPLDSSSKLLETEVSNKKHCDW